jgi:hypothetical protein
MGATQVFEAPGHQPCAHTFGRIQNSYFRGPLAAGADLGRSHHENAHLLRRGGQEPVPDVLGGDGKKTIRAVWEYLRLGEQMPKPEGDQ